MNAKNSTDFMPNKNQLKFLEAYISSEEGTIKAIAKEAGIEKSIIYNWRKNPAFVDWFNGEVAKAMKADLPDIYRAIKRRAKRTYPDSKLYLERFDKDYFEKSKVDAKVNATTRIVVLKNLKDLKPNGNNNTD
jgi:hypothetical protein